MSITRLTNWLRGTGSSPRKAVRKVNARLRTEKLEERDAPAIFTVTWDGTPTALGGVAEPVGAMTLQQAIAASNTLGGSNQINYGKNFTDGTTPIIQSFVQSTADAGIANGLLPNITTSTVIDGTTLVGAGSIARVTLRSTKVGDVVSGFD